MKQINEGKVEQKQIIDRKKIERRQNLLTSHLFLGLIQSSFFGEFNYQLSVISFQLFRKITVLTFGITES